MDRRIARLLEPNLYLYLVVMLLFSAATFAAGEPAWGIGEALAALLLFIGYQYASRRRRDKVIQYIDTLTGSVDMASGGSLVHSPLPIMVFRPDTREIIWGNEQFLKLLKRDEGVFDSAMDEVMPHFDSHWLMEGKTESPEIVELMGRHYRVCGSVSYASGRGNTRGGGNRGAQKLLATTYWIDTTECDELRSKAEATKNIVALIYHDNYEDVMKACGETAQSGVQAAIYEKISTWVEGSGCILTRYARDRFLLIIEQQYYQKLQSERFDVLERVREIPVGGGVTPTLSIGVGRDAPTLEALWKNAQVSVEMALSRGGDQAVVKDSVNFEFFGGRSKASEKRTKVKSRVMANALHGLMKDAKNIYIMGHKYADMDAVGAAAGLMAVARKLNKRAQIVIDTENNAAQELLARLRTQEEYRGAFIGGSEAFLRSEAASLLIVVDTNRPDFVESPQLLDACTRVAVIDHHRRAASYIEDVALNYHEPYASSASELVTELLQYMIEPGDLLKAEAEALLAGIVLDTKNFKQRTGGRTFEAAAFLRRSGADTNDVHRMFQGDLSAMISRFEIIRHAEMLHEHIALAVAEEETDRIIAAQAADAMLDLKGVDVTFVVFRQGSGVGLCARSGGDVNVQVILERLGGGGNSTMAGGFVDGGAVHAVAARLRDSIEQYLEEE